MREGYEGEAVAGQKQCLQVIDCWRKATVCASTATTIHYLHPSPLHLSPPSFPRRRSLPPSPIHVGGEGNKAAGGVSVRWGRGGGEPLLGDQPTLICISETRHFVPMVSRPRGTASPALCLHLPQNSGS